jgi:hypothetical protein
VLVGRQALRCGQIPNDLVWLQLHAPGRRRRAAAAAARPRVCRVDELAGRQLDRQAAAVANDRQAAAVGHDRQAAAVVGDGVCLHPVPAAARAHDVQLPASFCPLLLQLQLQLPRGPTRAGGWVCHDRPMHCRTGHRGGTCILGGEPRHAGGLLSGGYCGMLAAGGGRAGWGRGGQESEAGDSGAHMRSTSGRCGGGAALLLLLPFAVGRRAERVCTLLQLLLLLLLLLVVVVVLLLLESKHLLLLLLAVLHWLRRLHAPLLSIDHVSRPVGSQQVPPAAAANRHQLLLHSWKGPAADPHLQAALAHGRTEGVRMDHRQSGAWVDLGRAHRMGGLGDGGPELLGRVGEKADLREGGRGRGGGLGGGMIRRREMRR